jgi:hypothetical protein
MKCTLCKASIHDYSPDFNHLNIGESQSADICQACIDKFVRWQQNLYARLFPTAALKKIHRKMKGEKNE